MNSVSVSSFGKKYFRLESRIKKWAGNSLLALKKKNLTATDLTGIQNILKETGSIAYAQKAMLEFAQKAKDILGQFPQNDVNVALNRLVDFTIQRNK